MASKAFSGARATLYIGGFVVGWCTGVRGTENITLQRVDVLGNIDSEEIEPISRTVTMTADFVRIIKKSLQAQGIWPVGGTSEVIDFKEMTADIFDTIGDGDNEPAPVYTITGLKCESRNFTIDRQGLMTVNATFQAKRMFDESGIVD